MTLHWTDDPLEAGLDPARFEAVIGLAALLCDSGELPAISFVVGRVASRVRFDAREDEAPAEPQLRTAAESTLAAQRELRPPGSRQRDETVSSVLMPRCFGHTNLARTQPLPPDALFTVASITKPIVAMAVMQLVERGAITLGDRVTAFLPEFGRKGRYGIRIRHLLTHTSGLPDLLPEDRDLRRANAPLSEFLARTCQTELLFPPGRGVAYSSCGFLLLGEIVARVTGVSLPEYLRKELFEPLGMRSTRLGAPPEWFATPTVERFAEVRVPAEQADGVSWNWNSRYWRSLGAPWGGLISTATDLSQFAHMMLAGGRVDDQNVFSPASIAAATSNQLATMREVPEADRRCRPWGFGWRLNWPAHGAWFGDLLPADAYGHWGATGTLLWIAPRLDAFAVILTTQPQDPDGRFVARLSNAIVASVR